MSLTSKEEIVEALKWCRSEIKGLRVDKRDTGIELNAYRRVLSALESTRVSPSINDSSYNDKLYLIDDTIKELENELLSD